MAGNLEIYTIAGCPHCVEVKEIAEALLRECYINTLNVYDLHDAADIARCENIISRRPTRAPIIVLDDAELTVTDFKASASKMLDEL